MKLYKLTTKDNYTRKEFENACLWGEGVTHSGTGVGSLCSEGWIHAYTDPILAILLNPIHAYLKNPKLWECEGEISLSDNGLKVGCKSLTTIREIPVPCPTKEQVIAFAILCAKEVYGNSYWNSWADGWLSGEDRSYNAALKAYKILDGDILYINWRPNWCAARGAIKCASCTERFSMSAKHYAANVASTAAYYANKTGKSIDLKAIAHKAMSY